MRVSWAVGVALAVAGCTSDGSQYVESRGLPSAPAEPWKPRVDPVQPGDDERRSIQLRNYSSGQISFDGREIKAIVADDADKRVAGLSFVPVEKMEGAAMLFMMPNGDPRLGLEHLEFDADVVLADSSRRVLSVGVLDAPGGVVGEGSTAKYILVLPRGQAKRLKIRPGQSIAMGGGTMRSAGAR